MNRQTILSFIVLLTCLNADDTGKIMGSIFSSANGEPLIGANISIQGTVIGTSSDINGEFNLFNVPLGEQTIVASHIAHETRYYPVRMEHNKIISLIIKLPVKPIELQSIPVTGKVDGNHENGVLFKKKKSTLIEDGISSDQIAQNGDANAAEALRRITGASLKDGKYITIRGLEGRYVDTQVNGSPVASPEPDKKSIPLTLFPSALLESIIVIKTYSPDLPGAFAGGFVNIKTKAYPDKYLLNYQFSVKDNSSLHQGLSFNRSDGGAIDYLGFDDGTRHLPGNIPADRLLTLWSPPPGLGYDSWRQQLSTFGQEFRTSFRFRATPISKPISLGFNLGNHFSPSGNMEYGYFINGSFSNNYTIYKQQSSTFSLSESTYVPTHQLENTASEYSTNLAVGVSGGIKWHRMHSLKIYYLYTHTSSDKTQIGTGITPNIDQGVFIKQKFSGKSIRNISLSGMHRFIHKRSLEWKINLGASYLSEPDEKSHNYSGNDLDETYTLVTSSAKAGTRSFTSGTDLNGNIDIKATTPIHLGTAFKIKLTAGIREQRRSRQFKRRSFYHQAYGTLNEDFYTITGHNFGDSFNSTKFLTADHGGWVMVENTDESGRSAYKADEIVSAQFIMLNIPIELTSRWAEKLQIIPGVRREFYSMDLTPYNAVTGTIYENPLLTGHGTKGEIRDLTLLPSLTISLDCTKNIKLKMAYSRTLARPQFRELAPLEYQEYYGGDVVVGYQNLKPTDITNFDIRLEWYRQLGELMSLGFFRKELHNPIEATRFETADLIYKTYQNSPSGRLQGIELELRKELPVLESIGTTKLTFNSTLSKTKMEQNEMIILFNGETVTNSAGTGSRPLQGQSNMIINTELSFTTHHNFQIAAAFNNFSKRLVSLGSGNVADEYEYPFPSLNLTARKNFESFSVKIKLINLLDSSIRFGQIEPGGKLRLTNTYQPGRQISINVEYQYK